VTELTPNIRLIVPFFDQVPWDVDVNTNWQVLDAVVGMFAAIPNLSGIWKNSTAYTYGQSTIDATDSSVWQCVQTHTSPALPTTFAQDRTTNPARWIQTAQAASFYASQAASYAAAAQAAATAAANSAAAAGSAVPLAGGTMTGPLILFGDPINVSGAATKQYVDARVGGVGFLPTTGGVLTGSLTVGGNGVQYSNQGSNAHQVAFGWNGSSLLAAVDGISIGAVATQATIGGLYLPLAGGTINGNLVVNGEMQTDAIYRINTSGAYIWSNPTETIIQWDSGGWSLRYTRGTGTLWYRRSDGLELFHITAAGDIFAPGTLTTSNGLVANGGVTYLRTDNVFWGPGDRSFLRSDNGSFTDIGFLDAYRWNFSWASGTLFWRRWDSAAMFSIDANGSIIAAGSITAVGGGVQGNGPYVNSSDTRMKSNIEPSTYGLETVKLLEPIRFNRLEHEHIDHGFSAQQVQEVLPEAVKERHDGLLGVALDPIVVALVNGMKELSQRISKLESE